MDMTDDDEDDFEMTPAVVQRLQELCARRSTMPDDAFADGLCGVLEIERAMLDKATAIQAAGMREDVEFWLMREELTRKQTNM
jgi:hypothetical protein